MDAPSAILVSQIYPNRRARAVDRAAIKTLATSMDAIGLQTPITVRPITRPTPTGHAEGFEIVAGRHRYEAALQLKWAKINCFVQAWDDDDAALWEIDENLIRAELSDAQRAEHHARRRELMVKKGLVAAHGGDRRSSGQVGHLKSYTAETAVTVGQSERAVRRDLERGSKIAPNVLAAVQGTKLDKGVVLDALAKTAPEKQPAKLAELKAKADAPKPAPRAEPTPLAEKQAQALLQAWMRTPEPGRQWFLETIGAVIEQRKSA